jgi:hypothetical protein
MLEIGKIYHNINQLYCWTIDNYDRSNIHLNLNSKFLILKSLDLNEYLVLVLSFTKIISPINLRSPIPLPGTICVARIKKEDVNFN